MSVESFVSVYEPKFVAVAFVFVSVVFDFFSVVVVLPHLLVIF